jgi:hypothetical protein
VESPESVRIDIDLRDGQPVYSLGQGAKPAAKGDSNLASLQEVIDRLKDRLARTPGSVEVVINAHKDLKSKYCREVLVALQQFRGKISFNYYGVRTRPEE